MDDGNSPESISIMQGWTHFNLIKVNDYTAISQCVNRAISPPGVVDIALRAATPGHFTKMKIVNIILTNGQLAACNTQH